MAISYKQLTSLKEELAAITYIYKDCTFVKGIYIVGYNKEVPEYNVIIVEEKIPEDELDIIGNLNDDYALSDNIEKYGGIINIYVDSFSSYGYGYYHSDLLPRVKKLKAGIILYDPIEYLDKVSHLYDDKNYGSEDNTLSLDISNPISSFNKLPDYPGALGKAVIEARTCINEPCSNINPFGTCNITDCLYCPNAKYRITYETGEELATDDNIYQYPYIHKGCLDDEDFIILFYDRIPPIDELYDYLFDDNSSYKIVRVSDNVVLNNTVKERKRELKKEE